ncbi:MAG: transcriptional repressor [Beijerinckiaceae bacterium]|nr:transcriptional repressor [Beijerinckiaceae bacterium]
MLTRSRASRLFGPPIEAATGSTDFGSTDFGSKDIGSIDMADDHPPPQHDGQPGLTHICVHEHAHPPLDIMAAAERHCREQGLRLTDQRRAVLALLAHSPTPLGAYELLERTAQGVGQGAGQGGVPAGPQMKRLAPISIYRSLDFLLEAGLIHRLESRNAFIVCPHRHGRGDTIVFMLCESCGRVDEATSDDIHKSLKGLASKRGFELKAQVIELAGRCSQCGEQAHTAGSEAVAKLEKRSS